VKIGFMPAWRALPAGMGAGIENAANTMKELMQSPTLDPATTPAKLAKVLAGLMQDAGPAAANGAPGAPAATSSGFSTLMTANVALTATYTSAAAVPGGQPAAMTAYTEGIKAAAAAFASAAMASLAGVTDIHTCPIPCPVPPHGPGVVTKGSKSVLINNLPAVRKDDKVFEACGGEDPIAMGCPTVFIGDDGGGPAAAGAAPAAADAGDDPDTLAQAQSAAAALANGAASGAPLIEIAAQCGGLGKDKKKHHVVFQVIDEDTGQPCRGVSLKVKLPDGTEEQHVTDSDGMIEIDGLDRPGQCEVTCEFTRIEDTFDFEQLQSQPG
ncbi:MAG TPA: PAAR domain-containing protein, partial [Phycisphaerae bacterium]